MPLETRAFRRCVENAFRSFVSEKQIPTASTLTRSWVGPGAATILARLWTSCPGPTNWIACWVIGRAGTSGGVWFTWRFLVAAGRDARRGARPPAMGGSSAQHHLAAGDGQGLAGLVPLGDKVVQRDEHVGRRAAAAHGDPGLVEVADIVDRLRPGHLALAEVLDEEAAVRVGPQRPVEEVARADGIDLDAVANQLQRERLGQPDPAELRPRIGAVTAGADEPGLGVDLDDVAPRIGLHVVLTGHDRGGEPDAQEVAAIVDLRDEVEICDRLADHPAGAEHARVRDEEVEPAVAHHCRVEAVGDGLLVR